MDKPGPAPQQQKSLPTPFYDEVKHSKTSSGCASATKYTMGDGLKK